jgi:hypothetical protein
MLDAGVRVIDRLIQLIEKRHSRREHYFTAFVDPVFRDAEEVAKDYIGLFGADRETEEAGRRYRGSN